MCPVLQCVTSVSRRGISSRSWRETRISVTDQVEDFVLVGNCGKPQKSDDFENNFSLLFPESDRLQDHKITHWGVWDSLFTKKPTWMSSRAWLRSYHFLFKWVAVGIYYRRKFRSQTSDIFRQYGQMKSRAGQRQREEKDQKREE